MGYTGWPFVSLRDDRGFLGEDMIVEGTTFT